MGCYKTTVPVTQEPIPRSFSTELKRKDSSSHKMHTNLKNLIQLENEAFTEEIKDTSSDELEIENKRSNIRRRSSNVLKASNALMSSRGVKFIKPGEADLETIIEKEKEREVEKPKKIVKNQSYKLPPIAKCSEDFNAVLQDIQRDNF